MSAAITVTNANGSTNGSDDFRKRVEYLEAIDDGWRNVLTDVDSLIKTFSSLTAQAAQGDLKTLIEHGKVRQAGRRAQLDNAFDTNLTSLQQGNPVEETAPIGSQFADMEWSNFVKTAWCSYKNSGNCPQSLQVNDNDEQLSKSLPSSALYDNLLNGNGLSRLLLSKQSSQGNNNHELRRHSVFAPGETNNINRFSSWRNSQRFLSSSVDSRGSLWDDLDSMQSGEEGTVDDGDWDFDSMFTSKTHSQRHLSKVTNTKRHLNIRRGSSPPSIPPYAYDASENNALRKDYTNSNSQHHIPRRSFLGLPQEQQILHPQAVSLIKASSINPLDFTLDTNDARYIVIKSFTEESIFSSIKFSVWCSTFRGNQRLDKIYRSTAPSPIYLFFSVNNTGNFCGVAKMTSPVDFDRYVGCWSTPRWKGAFGVKWIYVKDVPFRDFREIVLPEDNKPVCKSRDTQEILPPSQGVKMLRIFHERRVFSSIFDDYEYYDEKMKRQTSERLGEQQSSSSSSNVISEPIPVIQDDDFDNF